MNKRAQTLISALELSPHPEGGYYKEVYRSAVTVHSPLAGEGRNAVTDIYFLLLAGQVSRFHRVLHDEIWHFYEGAPLILIDIAAVDLQLREVGLGGGGMPDDRAKLSSSAAGTQGRPMQFKHCVQGGNWQAAYSTGEYSLVGCTVAPGFAFSDFTFLADDIALQEAIITKYPDVKRLL
ncbi:MAG: cupin domain-containing protein [Desulforhopalus sp.]|nr:cupin domain-containing protein [Desulforhopalus sp.]